jgi:HEAT repeat protein
VRRIAPAPDVRALALRALTDLRSERALETLVRALEARDTNEAARRCLARVAGKDHGPRADAWRRWLAETERGGKVNA